MSTRGLPIQSPSLPQPQRPKLRILKREPLPISTAALRVGFWAIGLLLASAQAWIFRFQLSADSVSYLDLSDAVLPGSSWHRLINGVWSPLYPFLLGVFRRVFHISPGDEIVAGHLLNIAFFVFAFLCFEFMLGGVLRTLEPVDDTSTVTIPLPRWTYLPVAYSLFLWATIAKISLTRLRPDLLMSALLYLAVGMLLRMNHKPARWVRFLALGAILGTGFLAKAPMLPIGMLVLIATFFVVEDWRPAVKMAAAALAVLLLIGGLYFIPLSRQLGHFTLGEAGRYNYVIHVNNASPAWYLQSPGGARGSFLRPPEKISSDPPAYAFALPGQITHPLRFDPSYWIEGVRPHLGWKQQLKALRLNLFFFKELLGELSAVGGAVFVLAFLGSGRKQIVAAVAKTWPVWSIGLAGCVLFAMVHVEGRYVGAFLALFWLGLFIGLPLPREVGRRIALLIVITTFTALLYPMVRNTYAKYAQPPQPNVDWQAAQALSRLGLQAGDAVARISPWVSDYGAERLLRTEVVAEVDYAHARQFWDFPVAVQRHLLQTFAQRGVKAVIATSPKLVAENQSEWTRLGSTQLWVWFPRQP